MRYAKKSLTKVINHRIDKLTTFLNANESQLNVQKTNGITIKREIAINETNDTISCSSNIKANLFLMRSKVESFIKKHKCKTYNTKFKTSTQQKRFIKTFFFFKSNFVMLLKYFFICNQIFYFKAIT